MTPASTHNSPGLPSLAYRVGTHGRFMQSMRARLSTMEVVEFDLDGVTTHALRPLQSLTTRDSGDFSIALLDGWATVGDVLSFYQERIANEGYLRTATERRSVLELSRLVGYALRPGVASTVYLAYTVDDNQADATTIATGARVQSLPGPGESPQSFETSEDLVARREWNDLQVRRARPQNITLDNVLAIERIHVAGTSTNLKTGDLLLMLFGTSGDASALRSVKTTNGPFGQDATTIELNPVPTELAATAASLHRLVNTIEPFLETADGATSRSIAEAQELLRTAYMDHTGDPSSWAEQIVNAADGVIADAVQHPIDVFESEVAEILDQIQAEPQRVLTDPAVFVNELLKPRIPQVANSVQLRRDLAASFRTGADTSPQILVSFAPDLKDSYYAAWSNADVNDATPALSGVFALRVSASLFGSSVPKQPVYVDGELQPQSAWLEWDLESESKNALFLDQLHESIAAPGYAVVQSPNGNQSTRRVYRLTEARTTQRFAYGVSGKTTRLAFASEWWRADPKIDMAALRSTVVYAQGESLALVEEPITADVSGQRIELGNLYEGLVSGRWVILSGERADIAGVSGVRASELLMISGVQHGYDSNLPGDKTHTTLLLATKTAFTYKRSSLAIHGNVVKATHGETRKEILGSGDGAQALQSFELKQPPLTFVSASTAAGAETTLHVYVDDVEWPETDSLAWLGPKDRGFATLTDDDGNTTVAFGNGEHGARLPTGVQNVRAVYRSGIGAGGNVRAEQISLLQTRPLGIKSVINPLRASGGADKEGRDLARENAPLSVMSLDRLVSVQDYADFARRFAGIAKAIATLASDQRRELVYLTIAGADDAPIDITSDLYRNLLDALRELGDADMPVRVDVRELKVLVLSAGIQLMTGYLWEPVAAAVRARLLDVFGFGRRALGQPALLSQVIAAIQGVRGVAYVDVDTFSAIPEKVTDSESGARRLVTQQDIADQVGFAVNRSSLRNAGLTSRAQERLPANVLAWPGGSDHGVLRPAELAIFTPAVADTLILNQIT